MELLYKKIERSALAIIILHAAWIVTRIFIGLQQNRLFTQIEYIQYIMNFDTLFVMHYANSSLINLMLVFLYVFLFDTYYHKNKLGFYSGLFFISAYAILGLIANVSQYTHLPILCKQIYTTNLSTTDFSSLYNWIHMAPGSFTQFINAIAHASISTASIIVAIKIIHNNKFGKYAALLLFISAALWLIAFAGIYYRIDTFSYTQVSGTLVFFVALIFIYMHAKVNKMQARKNKVKTHSKL
jgi:hypothetical protein